MTYVAKLSLPGYNVQSATPEQCVFHSSYPPLKSKTGQATPHFALIDVDFSGTVTQDVTHTVYAINHGYGYVPFALANIIFDHSTGTEVGLGYAAVGGTLMIKAYCDATQFLVTVYDNDNWISATARLRVSYYIFAENGS